MIHKISILFLLVIPALLLVGGCATLPEDFEKSESYVYADTDDTPIGKARRDEINAHSGHSGFLLLVSGLDAFLARTLLAENTERSIDVQYYLYHEDLIGRLFTDQLFKAADRGVRVRLLVDDMDLGGRGLGAAVADSHLNIEVRIFNPFSRETNALRGKAPTPQEIEQTHQQLEEFIAQQTDSV